ncbi:MAG: STAS domain-containing protein [Anaerolineales bacterium]|nr:MAG: STAS domain-containing protein [Anaerolineales bacterium]
MDLVRITQLKQNRPVSVFRLQERISLDNFAELEAITKREQKNGMYNLVLDLSETPALTSIGVRAIVVIHKLLSADGGNPLKLAAVQPSVRDVLNIAGITKFIEIFETVDEAAKSFQ